MMHVIHKICLKPGVTFSDFEQWVVNTDYKACEHLSSVRSFRVYRTNGAFGCDYIESIEIASQEAFDVDMTSAVFKELEADFYAMADVVGDVDFQLVGQGYHQPHES